MTDTQDNLKNTKNTDNPCLSADIDMNFNQICTIILSQIMDEVFFMKEKSSGRKFQPKIEKSGIWRILKLHMKIPPHNITRCM